MPKTEPADRLRRHFALVANLEEPLDQALAFARAVEMMGFGLKDTDDDLAHAFVAVAEALTGELKTAKITWRKIMTGTSLLPSSRSQKARPISSRGRSGGNIRQDKERPFG